MNTWISFFLNRGLILAILSLSGKIPVDNDWLMIVVSGIEISSLTCLISRFDMLSYPQLKVFLKPFITLAISSYIT